MKEEVLEDHLVVYSFNLFSKHNSLRHFVSGRAGGVSTGETGSLNLSFSAPDERENVVKNRERIASALKVSPSQLIFPQQTHSDHISVVTKENLKSGFPDTDALVTNERGVAIAVMSADCVPVLLYDPVKSVVGAVHAGWRGTVQKIAAKTIDVFVNQFGSAPENIIAGIGPSICQEKYEVGEEVIEAVNNAFGEDANLLKKGNPGKAYLNLWQANKLQLLQKGLKPENIEISGICTFENSDKFFSARKSKESGRFAAFIVLST